MNTWIARPKRGSDDSAYISNGYFFLPWKLPKISLAPVQTRTELDLMYAEANNTEINKSLINITSQIFAFLFRAQVGEEVIMPLSELRTIRKGVIESEYEFLEDSGLHTRRMKWESELLPMSELDKSLKNSLKAHSTFYRVRFK